MMTDQQPNRGDGTPSHIHIERHKQPDWLRWLAWFALLAGLLALLLALSRCDDEDNVAGVPVAPATTAAPAAGGVVAQTENADASAALAGTSGLGTYLAGTEPAPRSFVFESINFDTASSDIRPADTAEIVQVAATLQQYPSARVRIAGYADARGSDPVNMALGKARADRVKAALVAQGVDAAHIETVSGGENEPVDTNATESGRFENRRTELVVTAR
jgi:outer membrane protein OmpA-like peptidoglycan-associated protein